MQLTTSSLSPSRAAAVSSKAFIAAMLATCVLVPTEAYLSAPLFAVHSKTIASSGLYMARSENSKRTNDRDREHRGGPQDFQYGGGQDYDYSGGNLKYGTGKYTQRVNDGYQGGVNLSKNGRSMQDSVYREDRDNVERARGRPSYGSRMDEIEDLERGMGRSREGMRDRMMRNRRNGRGGGEFYDDDGSLGRGGMGIRDRMGGSGLLRDMQEVGGRNRDHYGAYDDFGSPPKIMGGSSKGRGGGYRSSQFENGLSNERRRYEEYGFRMNDYLDHRDGIIDYESIRSGESHNRRQRGGGRPSNFDRMMGRDNFDDYRHEMDDDYRHEMDDYNRNGRGGGRRGHYDDGFYDDYGEDRGRGGGGGGRLLRDMRR